MKGVNEEERKRGKERKGGKERMRCIIRVDSCDSWSDLWIIGDVR